MQETEDMTIDGMAAGDKEAMKERFVELAKLVLKRVILLVSFGPGIVGCLWLIGKIFKR